MKIRAGFVSNSSSSSFIVSSKQYSVTEEERKKAFKEVFEYTEGGLSKEIVDDLKKRYENGEYITWLNIPYDCFYENEDFEKTYTQFGVEIILRDV